MLAAFLTLMFVSAFGALNGFGQATTGSISGVVTDQTGGAVPGAMVKVINLETKSERETIASSEGLFTVPRLSPGQYVVRVTKQGFQMLELRPVTVTLAQDTSLQPQLQVGNVTETVVIEASTPLIETTTAQVNNTFATKAVTELPAVSGQLDTLALLSPGVINGISAFINSNGAAISANGQRQKSNNFTIDGQDNNDTFVAGPMLFLSNIDVVREFSIITNNFSAEYGRNQGAIVNIITRSGTNDLHGAIYGYHRNSVFDANTFDNNRNGLTKPRFNSNTDGGTIGGPFNKDKAFFFGYFQSDIGKSVSQPTTNNNARVITPSGLATLINRCGATKTLAAYRDAGPFAQAIGNPRIVPGSAANPTYTPIAGDACGSTPFTFETARITRTTPTPFQQYDFGMKYDFLITPRDTLNTRYLFQDRTDKNLAFAASGYEFDRPERSQNLGVTYTRQLSNRQINEFRFNYGRFAFAFEGANTFPVSQIGKNVARFRMPGGFLSFGLPTTEPENRIVETFQFVDNWSLQVGRHALKAGAEIRRQTTEIGFLPLFNGQYTFNSVQNFANNIGDVAAAAGQFSYNLKETDTFFYFQDDFRIKPNLTLNLGIRYEYTGQPMNLLHDITVARESDPSKAFWLTSLPVEARTIPALKADKNNIAPRVGFAYTPKWGAWLFGKDKSVIRGGFSMAYDPAFFNLLSNVWQDAPNAFSFNFVGVNGLVPADVTGDGLKAVYAPPRGAFDPRTARFRQTQMDPDLRPPYAENWSLGIQRGITTNSAFEIRYVGTRGVALYQTRNGNPDVRVFINNGFANAVPSGITPAPISGRVSDSLPLILRTRGNTAASTYHGLQTQFRGQLFNQLTTTLSYTYSHNIDNVSDVFQVNAFGVLFISQNPFDIKKGERGSSNIDLRHSIAWSFIWDVPAFKDQQGLLGRFLGGWSASGVYRWNTGRPFSPACFFCASPVRDIGWTGAFYGSSDVTRPFDGNRNAPIDSVGSYTSPTTFINVATGQPTTPDQVRWIFNNRFAAQIFGTPFGIGRNTLSGPNFGRANFALYKNVKISERSRVQFRWEAENVFNTPFLGTPDFEVDDAPFGTYLNPAASAFNVFPRRMVFGVRFLY